MIIARVQLHHELYIQRLKPDSSKNGKPTVDRSEPQHSMADLQVQTALRREHLQVDLPK